MTNSADGTAHTADPAHTARAEDGITLRLRGKLQWIPVAAVVVVIAWAAATGSVFDGPNQGAVAGTMMVIGGVLLAAIAVAFAGHLVRPMRVRAGAEGLMVRLPSWPGSSIPWAGLSGVSAVAVAEGGRTRQFVVVDYAPGTAALPRLSRVRATYGRIAPQLGRDEGAQGLVFEEQIFDFDPAELLAAVRGAAPQGLQVSDLRDETYGEPAPESGPHA
ncbi:hypothetical protein [Streptomyces beijiangensis]|uniref:PH domain-containing protein n=1 Tax=Streptomyces beijiangensis TaxID=163361 RepID=A0A939F964_9ACTN|nr:hypothetical protein [Streptomyces beijiangensis]MBO0513237.1 hypothetical protein [Streptomyces beijiangensis]